MNLQKKLQSIDEQIASLERRNDLSDHFHLGLVGGSGGRRQSQKQSDSEDSRYRRLTGLYRERKKLLRASGVAEKAAAEEHSLEERRRREAAMAEAERRLIEWFDALEVGDILPTGAKVAKKNPKSVVTEGGVRWTRCELTGVR